MMYAPIVIPTLNRYEHFKRCVESLARCPEAIYTTLYIALDFPLNRRHLQGYGKIKEYVRTIGGFKEVVVFERHWNMGVSVNFHTALIEVFDKHDRLISTEDDNVFSPSFLRYMNMALEHYHDDERVLGVSGYLPPITTEDVLAPNETFLYNGFFAYGYGTWRNRLYDGKKSKKVAENIAKNPRKMMRILKEKDYIFSAFSNMVRSGNLWGDVFYSGLMILENKCLVCPPMSLVRNEGLDGSGVNSADSDPDNLMCQPIVEAVDFVPVFEKSGEKARILQRRIDIRRQLSFKRRIAAILRWAIWAAARRIAGV